MKTKTRPRSGRSRRRYRRRDDSFGSPLRDGAGFVLLAGLFLAFVGFSLRSADSFNAFKLTMLWVSGTVALVLWSVDLIRGEERIPRLRLAYVAGAFLVALALATAFSVNPMVSLIGTHTRYGGLLPYLLYGAIFLILADLYRRRPERLRGLLLLVVVAAVVLAGYVVIQWAGLDPIPWTDPHGRPIPFPVGTLGNSNFNGGLLAIALPAVGYLFLSSRSLEGRGIAAAVGALLAAGLWIAQSRGGMLAAVVGMGAFALILRHRFPRWVRGLLVLGMVAVLVVAGVVVWRAAGGPAAPLGGLDVLRERTVAQRVHTWTAAAEIFRDHPGLGTGPETFFELYPEYRPPSDAARTGLAINDKPHNVFLEHAAGAGAVGILAFLALFVLAFWWGLRALGRLNEPRRLLLGTLLAMLVAYMVQAAFSIDVPPLAAAGWLALAGIAALADPGADPGAKRPTGPGPRRHPALVTVGVCGVAILGLVLLVAGIRFYAADRRAGEAQEEIAADADPERVAAEYRRAIELNPYEPAYRSNFGAYLDQHGLQLEDEAERRTVFEDALEHFEGALRLRPRNVIYLTNVARLHGRLASEGEVERFGEAERLWTDAAERDPHNWEVHHGFGVMLASWGLATEDVGLFCRAEQHVARAAEIRPRAEVVRDDLAEIRRAIEHFSEGAGCP